MGNTRLEFCDRLIDGSAKTCKEMGSLRLYEKRKLEEPAIKEYKRSYKAHRKEIKPMEQAEITRFLQAIQGTKYGLVYQITLFTGLRVALSTSWATLVAAEMLAAQKGLGYMIQTNRMLANADNILVGMLLIGVIGAIFSLILGLLEKQLAKGR